MKDIVAVAHSQMEMGGRGGKCGKNGLAQKDTGNMSVGRKNRQKENWNTEDLKGRHVQDSSRWTVVTNRQTPERME